MATLFTRPPAPAKPAGPRDSVRETLETIVFVVALVLMLKLFVVEAFVIPTGSMAETLYGYQKQVTCPQCAYEYPVNSSDEVDPQDGVPRAVTGATCPNCRQRQGWRAFAGPGNRSGDRVLVHKALYALGGGPHRGDVVVFKYPVDPQVNHTAQNYIKRLWGLGGETIAIYRGDLYLHKTLTYPADAKTDFGEPKYPRPPGDDPLNLWEGPMVAEHSRTNPRYAATNNDYTYHNTDAALAAFEASRQAGFPDSADGFTLIRKPAELCLSMRRIVYDNDHQSKFLAAKGVPPRWTAPDGGWTPDAAATPKVFTHAGPGDHWLRYAHRVSGRPTESADRPGAVDDWAKVDAGYADGLFPAGPITNFLGYNSAEEKDGDLRRSGNGAFWVPDLMVECTAKLDDKGAAVMLELGKAGRRFRATFSGRRVTLTSNGAEVASAAAQLNGTYDLRFADFDGRLRVWVDGRAVKFGPEVDLPPWDATGFVPALGGVAGALAAPAEDGLHPPTDLSPAAIGAAGGVEVSHVKLWMDTYFTPAENSNRSYADRDNPVDTFYVQPGHNLCLGDNSGQSSDSRKWGLVPDRLLLGKAQFVFFPLGRVGFIK